MRKPDGYVTSTWKKYLAGSFGQASIWAYPIPEIPDHIPVCLVSPKLLDWVEEARRELDRAPKYGPPEMSGMGAGTCEDLLAELEKIWPEGKDEKA